MSINKSETPLFDSNGKVIKSTESSKQRIIPYKETHQQGNISVEKDLSIGHIDGDFGVQISSDGRVWICIDGLSVIRFNPRTNTYGKRSKSD